MSEPIPTQCQSAQPPGKSMTSYENTEQWIKRAEKAERLLEASIQSGRELADCAAEELRKAHAELDRVKAACAEMRQELVFWTGSKHAGDCEFLDKSDEGCWRCQKAERERWPLTEAILSSDAGKDFVPLAEVQPLIRAIEAVHRHHISVIPNDHDVVLEAFNHAKEKGWIK